MLSTSAELIAENLRRYGEPAVAEWMETCTDDELLRVCSVADWLLHYGPALHSGASMLIDKASALAAVYVCEGSPRELARDHRKGLFSGRGSGSGGGRRPNMMAQLQAGQEYGVGQDARDFWATGQ